MVCPAGDNNCMESSICGVYWVMAGCIRGGRMRRLHWPLHVRNSLDWVGRTLRLWTMTTNDIGQQSIDMRRRLAAVLRVALVDISVASRSVALSQSADETRWVSGKEEKKIRTMADTVTAMKNCDWKYCRPCRSARDSQQATRETKRGEKTLTQKGNCEFGVTVASTKLRRMISFTVAYSMYCVEDCGCGWRMQFTWSKLICITHADDMGIAHDIWTCRPRTALCYRLQGPENCMLNEPSLNTLDKKIWSLHGWEVEMR
jgi:hypothetical protein